MYIYETKDSTSTETGELQRFFVYETPGDCVLTERHGVGSCPLYAQNKDCGWRRNFFLVRFDVGLEVQGSTISKIMSPFMTDFKS
jgi:hypothetical protein